MSIPHQKLPVSAVIFDRTQKGLSDVPVFASALKQKINTPPVVDDNLSARTRQILASVRPHMAPVATPAPAISVPPAPPVTTSILNKPAHSTFRADSARGQTSEFAQRAEPKEQVVAFTPGVSVELFRSPLYEDPELLRPMHTPEKLLEFLHKSTPVVVRPVTIPPLATTLETNHTKGLVDVVVLPTLPSTRWEAVEPLYYGLKRLIWQIRYDLLSQERFSNLQDTAAQKLKKTLRTLLEKLEALRDQLFEKTSKVEFVGVIKQKRTQNISSVTPAVTVSVDITEVRGALTTALHELKSFSRSLPPFEKVASRLLISGALVLMLLTVGPMVVLEAQSWKQKLVYSLTPKAGEEAKPVAVGSATPTPQPTPSPIPAPDQQFQILIPKIGVNSRVIANVDAGSEKEYTEALKKGVAHAAGTNLPGEPNSQTKSIFIFGHSTDGAWNISRYNALFYSLKDLVAGDDVTVWFWGREFKYKVTERKIVEATDTSFLAPQTEKDKLILQTCWPPGTAWKRLIVVAEPVQ